MSLDLLALLILVVFMGLGAYRGTIASGSGFVSLVVSYAAAVYAAGAHGALVAERFSLPGIFGPPAAGMLGFSIAFLVCGVLSSLLLRWDGARRRDEPRPTVDRLGGALFGGLRGALVVVLVSVLATWLDAARDLGVLEGLSSPVDSRDSVVGTATGRLIEKAVESAINEDDTEGPAPVARVMARIAADPGPSLDNVKALLEDDRLARVQEDRMFWVLVENGAGERALNRLSIYSIVHDEEMRGRLAQLGLVSPEAAADPDLFRETVGAMLTVLGPRLKGLRNDPEVLALAEDPEIVAMLEAGDTLALMTDPRIQRVVQRVAAAE